MKHRTFMINAFSERARPHLASSAKISRMVGWWNHAYQIFVTTNPLTGISLKVESVYCKSIVFIDTQHIPCHNEVATLTCYYFSITPQMYSPHCTVLTALKGVQILLRVNYTPDKALIWHSHFWHFIYSCSRHFRCILFIHIVSYLMHDCWHKSDKFGIIAFKLWSWPVSLYKLYSCTNVLETLQGVTSYDCR